jgi:hypothetical protein
MMTMTIMRMTPILTAMQARADALRRRRSSLPQGVQGILDRIHTVTEGTIDTLDPAALAKDGEASGEATLTWFLLVRYVSYCLGVVY